MCGVLSFPDKHKVELRALLNWAKKYRKKIKAGAFPENLRLLFEALEASRSDEHTGGGRRQCELWKLRQEVIISSDDLVFPRIVTSVRTNFHFYIYDRRI